jgi:hypothetical protein
MTTLHRQPNTLTRGMLAVLLAMCALLPSLAVAQAYSLHVSLHDADAHGLAGIVVIVRGEDGEELARALTSAEGAATFAGLPSVVHVAVEGQAHGGPALFQLGDDAQGVRLDLAQAGETPSLDLRVERDGLVLPDPATMITREEGGPVVAEASPIPTAALATPAPLPTAPAAGALPAVVVGEPAEARPSSPSWVPWLTVLIVAVAAGVLRVIQRRRDAR